MVKLFSNKEGRKGLFKIDVEIFEVVFILYVVEVKKVVGDIIEYYDFCDYDLMFVLRDIVWIW